MRVNNESGEQTDNPRNLLSEENINSKEAFSFHKNI